MKKDEWNESESQKKVKRDNGGVSSQKKKDDPWDDWGETNQSNKIWDNWEEAEAKSSPAEAKSSPPKTNSITQSKKKSSNNNNGNSWDKWDENW